MKEHDRLLHYRARELEKVDYQFDNSKDKQIFNHALLYMKKKKQMDVFGSTYFVDPKTTAEELESVIYYASILGDTNYYKNSEIEHYSGYLDGTIRYHLCDYLTDRKVLEDHYKVVDFNESEDDRPGVFGCLLYPTLDISDFSFAGLTDREIQAVIYYTYGFDDDYVADVLNLSKNTIRTFRRRGLKKMRKTNDHQKLLDLSQPITED